LERRGLLERSHSERDRRSVTVELTKTGRSLIDRAAEDLVAAQAELLTSLTKADRAQLAHLLAKLAGALDAGETRQ